MPRFSTLFAGITLVTVLTYQSRINLISNTADVQKEVDEVKNKVDRMASTDDDTNQPTRLTLRRPTTAVENAMDDATKYYKNRFVPSVKESWNAQVLSVTRAMIHFNLPARCKRMIVQNIFGTSS
ncbi:hypothetical protein BDF20DRAFT_694886 [Mycotypha africana]|uniref:uncharacterized protein n=1 Tax=Mycotypha africana TaxID=64632 RepID=UPI0023006212|nr:uncharacterized protein BDF20DRAFT_694886 [Mycotypha africana]KAI8971713.1 hypothetical protein BDF20DRAFT_694886 [Mycotypha africana]